MSWLFSLAYWIFFGISAIVLFLGALVICATTALFDPTRRILHRYTCWWSMLYLRILPGCKMIVEGREKIVPDTPYVFVANHQSVTDVMALAALTVPFKWVSKKENVRIPCIGWNIMLNQSVIVDRGNVASVAKTMAACRRWLERGVPLLMFPEGHRSSDGEIAKFHNGAFKLAEGCSCPVVPIVVNGTRGIYDGLKVRVFPGVITLRVLEPVTVEQAGGKADKLRDLVHERMVCALAEMRGQRRETRTEPCPA